MNGKHSPPRSFPAGPFDPYLDWAIRNNFRHLRPGDWLPILVRFDASAQGDPHQPALSWFTKLDWLDAGLKKSVRVPDLFLKPPQAVARAKSFDFCVLFVAKKEADTVTKSAGWNQTIRSMSLSPPLDLPTTSVQAPSPPPPQPQQGRIARSAGALRRLIGRLFARRTTMRQAGVLSLFTAPSLGVVPQQSGGTSPPAGKRRRRAVSLLPSSMKALHSLDERFRLGTSPRIEYSRNLNSLTESTASAIQAALADHTVKGFVDEDAVYREIGGLDYAADGFKALARRRSHGTHIASVASAVLPGNAPSQRPIIAVELPEASVADPVANYLYAYILLGVFYALYRAENLSNGQPLPVVCNISYGPHDGPHDGTLDFEIALDALIHSSRQSITPLEVVLAAGNSRQSRVHASFEVKPNQSRTLHWRLQPEDLLPSSLQLWVPTSAAAGITVTVTPPVGNPWTIDANNPSAFEPGPNGDVFWMWLLPPLNGSQRQEVLIIAQPTATDPPLDLSPPNRGAVGRLDRDHNNDEQRKDRGVDSAQDEPRRPPHSRPAGLLRRPALRALPAEHHSTGI